MKYLVLFSAALCSVSAVPLDAEYGVPSAPVLLHTAPAPQFLHAAAPLVRALPPVHAAPAPLLQHVQPAPFVPAPVRFINNPTAPIAPAFHSVTAPVAISQPARIAPAAVAPIAPVAIPSVPSSQFHAQDEFGQHSFGYQNVNSARIESKDALGVTRGSYQYVDANNILQTVNYVADDVNGFRVAATNIPVAVAGPAAGLPVAPVVAAQVPVMETPEVAAARAEHLAAHAAAKAAAVPVVERKRREAEPIEGDYEIPAAPVLVTVPQVHAPLIARAPAPFVQSAPVFRAPIAHPAPIAPVARFAPAPFAPVARFAPAPFAPAAPLVSAAPAPFAPAPVQVAAHTAPLPVAPTAFAAPVTISQPAPIAPVAIPSVPSSQFHAQDEFGQHSFGYQNVNSARIESKDAFGVTRGSYQYVDANNILQTVNYVADDVNGFRVAATNIPVAVAGPDAGLPVAPVLAAQVPVMETPEVAAARAEHLAAHAAAKAAVVEAPVERRRRSPEEEDESEPEPEPEADAE